MSCIDNGITPMQNTDIFIAAKMENFLLKIDILFICAQNIACGYTRVPTIYVLIKNKKTYNPVFPLFTVKSGLKGIYISRTCFHEETVPYQDKHPHYKSASPLRHQDKPLPHMTVWGYHRVYVVFDFHRHKAGSS